MTTKHQVVSRDHEQSRNSRNSRNSISWQSLELFVGSLRLTLFCLRLVFQNVVINVEIVGTKFWKPVLTLAIHLLRRLSRNFFLAWTVFLTSSKINMPKIFLSVSHLCYYARKTTTQNRTNFSYKLNHEMPTLKIHDNTRFRTKLAG